MQVGKPQSGDEGTWQQEARMPLQTRTPVAAVRASLLSAKTRRDFPDGKTNLF
jgi:hypothetical protein